MCRWLPIVLLLLFIPAAGNALAGDRDSTAARWGIATKKNLEDLPSSLPKKEKPAAKETQKDTMPSHAPMENGHAIPTGERTGTEKHPIPSSVNRKPDTAPYKHSSDEAPAPLNNKADHPSKKSSPTIEWASEKQETICQTHLVDLRKLFLETRHLSIQGASCETAVSASHFLASIDQCEKDCPTHFLEVNGYSTRIIRNIRYLKKLGHDRCDESD